MVTRCGCSNAADGLPSDAAAICRELRCRISPEFPFNKLMKETMSAGIAPNRSSLKPFAERAARSFFFGYWFVFFSPAQGKFRDTVIR